MIKIGDSVHVKKEYCGKRIEVKIVDIKPGKYKGELLYFTFPILGSGAGISAEWLEK